MTKNKTFSTRTTQKVLDVLDDLARTMGTSKANVFDQAVLMFWDHIQNTDTAHGTSQVVKVTPQERDNCRWPDRFDELSKENSVVYILTNTTTDHRYVGSTMKDFRSRAKGILSEARSGYDRSIHRAIRKYGINSFNVEIIQFPLEQLSTMEAYFIKELDTVNNGYNNTIHTSNSDHYRNK